jgi:thioredoxin 1
MKKSMFKSSGAGGLFAVALVAALLLLSAGCTQQAQVSTGGVYPPSATPRLVEIGTAMCIPCAMMKPALDQLKAEYAGRLDVEVIDIFVNPSAKQQYNAPDCATQIYIAASGKELFRHVGYSSKKDILANWKTLGVDLDAPPAQR